MAILYVPPKKDALIALPNQGGYLYQTGRFPYGDIGGWDWSDRPWSGYFMKQARALLQYEIPDLPKGSTLLKATLKMNIHYYQSYPSSWNQSYIQVNKQPIFNIHKVEESWDEGTGDGFTEGHQYTGATWTHRTNRGHGWSRQGGTFTEAPIAQQQADFTKSSTQLLSFDVTSMVNQWIARPAENYGILLRLANDRTVNEGRFNFWTKEHTQPSFFDTNSFYTEYVPTIHLEYSTPPEKPIGLEPNYFSTVSPNLPDSMNFKWTYVDELPDQEKIQQQTEIVFIIDTGSSYSWRKAHYKNQINRIIDRLEEQKVNYNIAMVGYADVQYAGNTIQRGYWASTRAEVMNQLDFSIAAQQSGDWRDSALEAIKDPLRGALTFRFREESKVHFVVIGESPYHSSNVDNLSIYNIDDVAQEMKNLGIVCTTVGSYFHEINRLSTPTGGTSLDVNANFGDSVPIHAFRKAILQEDIQEDSQQSKAVINIYEKTSGDSRVLKRTIEHHSSTTTVTVPTDIFANSKTYEWEVVTYDNHGLVSPPSEAAPFVYRTLTAPQSLPVWSPLPKEKEPIKRSHLQEIKQALLVEGSKYNNVNVSEIHQLFVSDLVPSKDDFDLLQKIFNDMAIGEGVQATEIINSPNGFGIQQLKTIRERIVHLSKQGPDMPTVGTATLRTNGTIYASTLRVETDLLTNPYTILRWDKAQAMQQYIEVPTHRVQDEDIAYYKLHFNCKYEYFVANKTKKQNFGISRTYYYTPDQIGGTNLEMKLDSDQYIDHKLQFQAVDKNQQSSKTTGAYKMESGPGGTQDSWFMLHQIEFQVRDMHSTGPNKEGTWYPLAQLPMDTYLYNHPFYGEGTLWYRLKPANSKEWVYSSDVVKKNTTYIRGTQ